MQGGHGYYGGRGSPPPGYGYGGYGSYGYDAGGYYPNAGAYAPAPAYEGALAGRGAHDVPAPLDGLELQPWETCPRNYVIFDQTCTRSRVMFHPSLAPKLGASSGGYDHGHYYGDGGGDAQCAGKSACRDDGGSCSLRQEEDAEEIDALLSSEEDDVVSTGRTSNGRDGSSPDSTCSSSHGGPARPEGGGGGKKDRMKQMVRRLRRIIPGGKEMDTPAVLDEAVRCLKSLKVEAKKLGVRGSDSSC
ncbi:hypothetical protein ACP4OV_004425 [Aristida adscensionis]